MDPVPVEPVFERFTVWRLVRAGAAWHRERHFGLHALGVAVRCDTWLCGAQGTPTLDFERSGCVLADDSLARVSGLTLLDSASNQISARVDSDGIGDPRISSPVVMSLRSLFWALRHLVMYRRDVHCMSLFLITCLIKARMGDKSLFPSRAGDGIRYCRQYRKRRNSDVRNIDTSVACG